jgi:small-conductance mechanosensitive channel
MRKVPNVFAVLLIGGGVVIVVAVIMGWLGEAQLAGYWILLPVAFAVIWTWLAVLWPWLRGRYRVWKNRHEIKALRRELAEMEEPRENH